MNRKVRIKISFVVETRLRDEQDVIEVVNGYKNMLGLKEVELISVEKVD